MVSNRLLTPNSSEKDELGELFPQTDFSTCVFVHEGREPASEEKSALMIIGGLGAVAVGLGSLVLALFVWRRGASEEARRKKRRTTGPLRGDEDDDEEPRPRRRRVATNVEEDERPSRKRRPVADDEDEAPTRRRRPVARDDDEEDRPRRRRDRDD
jgi:hypothetical protein